MHIEKLNTIQHNHSLVAIKDTFSVDSKRYLTYYDEKWTYNHRLYEVSISNFPEIMRNDNFMLNGKHYYWMSIDDMRKDKEIIKKNLQIVEFVHSHIK
ncbi:hypothetical protein [Holdemanella porci]|uniref:hypothetical protein n=1 Tax=Holdemanella porci TaxID=2652276 RepID=UPI002FDE4FAD